MLRRLETRTRTKHAIVAAIVCACFLFQQLFVLVHLAQVDHHYPGEVGERVLSHVDHAHGHGDHGHEHEAPDSKSSKDEHHPHPAVDHQVRIAARPNTGEFAGVDLALAQPAADTRTPDAVWVAEQVDGDLCPRPPPRLSADAPRAPPLVS